MGSSSTSRIVPAPGSMSPTPRLYGYWFWDWYEEYQKVAAIDAGTQALTLAKPYSQYGYRKGQRYRAVNVLRELDRPGEWYLDRRNGKLYWLPPEGDAWQRAAATVSVFARPFVQLEDVQHVILAGLTIEDGRGDGIHVARRCGLRRRWLHAPAARRGRRRRAGRPAAHGLRLHAAHAGLWRGPRGGRRPEDAGCRRSRRGKLHRGGHRTLEADVLRRPCILTAAATGSRITVLSASRPRPCGSRATTT